MSQEGSPTKSPNKSLHRPRIRRERKHHAVEEVKQLLENAVSSDQQSLPCVVRQIFEECGEEDEPCRKTVFEFCVLNGQRVNSQVVKEVVGKLLHEVDSLKGSSLIEVAELIIKGVKEGTHHALELFPKVLSVISSQKNICYRKEGGSFGEIEGSVQKSHLLNSLCGCRWEPSCVLFIADMCKDICMSSEELEFLIQKILRVMKTLNLSELPPLVYQLLVLSNKGHKELVLQGIQGLFTELDHEILKSKEQHTEGVMAISGGEKELLQTEGTVILHISFALKQGQELRKEYLKLLETTQARLSASALSPFSVALSLSVARMHRFENDVFKFLKEVVIKSFKDEERRKTSKWMQEVCDDVPDMDGLLMEIIEHSACGWDHVLQGLVMLGLNLMEVYAPKSASPTFGTPQHKTCCLGIRLLLKTFKMHRIVQEEVLNQVINRILTNTAGYVIHYIGLLGAIISTCPHVAMEFPPQLKEVFAYLSLLPSSAAVELLHTVLPVIQYSAAVRDSLILVLRKSLFTRQVESRKIAVGGYLLLLKKFTVLDSLGSANSQSSQTTHSTSSSQVTVEVHSGPSGNRALCLEILGTLRRSLTNQSDVRLSLYEGVYPVFCTNASLAEPIIDILIGHLKTYYENEQDIIPPIKFNLCLSSSGNEVIQVEPLDALVRCLQLCVTKFSEWEEVNNEEREIPPMIEKAQDILQSLIDRMGKSDPEDFELDKSSDFTVTSSVGQKNRTLAKLVMGIYETLLEYTFTIGEFSQESCDQTIKLYQAYHKISTIWQDKSSGVGASKKGPIGATQSWNDAYNLSLSCVIRLFKALFSDSLPNHQQPLSILRDSPNFVKYVVTAALRKTHQLREWGRCDGASINHEREIVFKQCCDLGKILFKQIETSAPGPAKKDRGKSNSALCLEGFHQLLQTMITWFNNPMSSISESRQQMTSVLLHDFLMFVNPALHDEDPSEGIHHFIKFFESVIVSVLTGHSTEWSIKDMQLMISTIHLLSNELDSESSQLKETFEWAYMQCKNQNVDDGPLTKALVSFMLTLNARHKGSVKTIGKLAKDVHYHLGDIDEEVELQGETSFAVVNPRTAASIILNLIYIQIDSILGDADWLINRLRSEISSSPSEDIFEGQKSPVGSQATDYCTTVCDRLIYIVSACSELVQTSLSPGPTTDGMFKVVTKLFTTLGNLTKYNLTVYPQTCTVLPSFRKLVSLVGKDLCQQVYSSIFFVQSCQASITGGNDQPEKSKKGTKRTLPGGKASIRREVRSVPNLIYAIEQLEKFLIKLDKKAKVNLMESFKRSTARDFRINTQLINYRVEDDHREDDSQQKSEAPPKAKRKKY